MRWANGSYQNDAYSSPGTLVIARLRFRNEAGSRGTWNTDGRRKLSTWSVT